MRWLTTAPLLLLLLLNYPIARSFARCAPARPQVNTLNENGFFGEKALLDQFGTNLRTASVRANERCELWTLSKDAFDELCVLYPKFAADVSAKTAADFDGVEQKHLNLASSIARKWREKAIRSAGQKATGTEGGSDGFQLSAMAKSRNTILAQQDGRLSPAGALVRSQIQSPVGVLE